MPAWLGTVSHVSQTLIERDEIVALLFNVSDIVALLRDLIELVGGDAGGEEEAD